METVVTPVWPSLSLGSSSVAAGCPLGGGRAGGGGSAPVLVGGCWGSWGGPRGCSPHPESQACDSTVMPGRWCQPGTWMLCPQIVGGCRVRVPPPQLRMLGGGGESGAGAGMSPPCMSIPFGGSARDPGAAGGAGGSPCWCRDAPHTHPVQEQI